MCPEYWQKKIHKPFFHRLLGSRSGLKSFPSLLSVRTGRSCPCPCPCPGSPGGGGGTVGVVCPPPLPPPPPLPLLVVTIPAKNSARAFSTARSKSSNSRTVFRTSRTVSLSIARGPVPLLVLPKPLRDVAAKVSGGADAGGAVPKEKGAPLLLFTLSRRCCRCCCCC